MICSSVNLDRSADSSFTRVRGSGQLRSAIIEARTMRVPRPKAKPTSRSPFAVSATQPRSAEATSLFGSFSCVAPAFLVAVDELGFVSMSKTSRARQCR